MSKESPLSALLGQLNREYSLSEEFKNRVTNLIERLEGLDLPADQVQTLSGKSPRNLRTPGAGGVVPRGEPEVPGAHPGGHPVLFECAEQHQSAARPGRGCVGEPAEFQAGSARCTGTLLGRKVHPSLRQGKSQGLGSIRQHQQQE